ncbi:MAG: hypothetical protein QM831_22200 [Kofleriaceae bacterium]
MNDDFDAADAWFDAYDERAVEPFVDPSHDAQMYVYVIAGTLVIFAVLVAIALCI